ncbi:hypothetical protein ACTNCR_08745 [Collinsella sp. HCP3S3_A7]|uniref:hypothetical protein n=1 Tax=unclassified Collinsella TaxID=2637548 RepID=UPI003F8ADD97
MNIYLVFSAAAFTLDFIAAIGTFFHRRDRVGMTPRYQIFNLGIAEALTLLDVYQHVSSLLNTQPYFIFTFAFNDIVA